MFVEDMWSQDSVVSEAARARECVVQTLNEMQEGRAARGFSPSEEDLYERLCFIERVLYRAARSHNGITGNTINVNSKI
jgi:hypothetical protein